MNILIVDDLLNNRKFLRDIMKPYGRCDMVADGREAVEMFEAELTDGDPYDLVLLDVMMPRMNGQEVLTEMRGIERKCNAPSVEGTPIFMVTAVDASQSILKAFYHGKCTDYIAKPFTTEQLLNKLREHDIL